MNSDFQKNNLWHGALLGGILNGVMCAKNENFDFQRQWVENAYLLDGKDGTVGTIVFEHGWKRPDGYMIGLFFEPSSPLSPYHFKEYNLDLLLDALSPPLKRIANETVRDYLTDAEESISEVTTMFWSEGENEVRTSTPWATTLQNGADLALKEFNGADEKAIAAWQADCGMSTEQVAISVALFRERLIHPENDIVLSGEMMRQLQTFAKDPLLRSCQHHLSSLRIYLPETL